MIIPRFTAEASLYGADGLYHMTAQAAAVGAEQAKVTAAALARAIVGWSANTIIA